MSRQKLIAGNWKMNTSLAEAGSLATGIADGLAADAVAQVVVCPPFPWLAAVRGQLAGSAVQLGAQDCSPFAGGAHTGDVSASMIAELAGWVIVGHSERRAGHGETDALVNAKARAALAAGLQAVVCVGEDLPVRESGNAVPVVLGQVVGSLSGLSAAELGRLVIAYEPVWAIGTGVAATAGDAQEMAEAIRGAIQAGWDTAVAGGLRILYGGSVNPTNAHEILIQPDVDGALVGGASLQPDAFLAIVAAAPR